MDYQVVLLLFSAAIFYGWFGLITAIYGVLPSISDGYYKLPDKLKFLFTFAIWGFSIPIAMAADTGLMFFAGAFISFVAAAPKFREKLEGAVHAAAAYGGILLGTLSLSFDFGMYSGSLEILLFTVIFRLLKVENETLWIELNSYTMIIFCMLLHIFTTA